jgi:Glu-tRNA(Gln) amidotransferase subunit E-like FAD-binding protein
MSENKQLATSLSFEEKLKARIKDSIGELLSDADLKRIIEASIEKTFFKEQTTRIGEGYSSRTETHPPVVQQILKELLQEKVKKVMEEWVVKNMSQVDAVLEKVIADGFAKTAIRGFESIFASSLYQFTERIQNDLNNIKSNL